MALVFAAGSVLAGFYMGGSLDAAAYTLIGGVVAAMGVRHCTHRSVAKAELILGAVNAAVNDAHGIEVRSITGDAFRMIAVEVNGIATSSCRGHRPALESAFSTRRT